MFKNLREPVNGLTHFIAGLAAVIGLIVLVVVARDDVSKQLSLVVYGTCLILLLMASSAYHLIKASPERIQILRKLDHTAIYFLIAGTYTPICFNILTGFWRWGLLAIIWTMALVGSGFKIAFIKTPRILSAIPYIVMGCLGILGGGELFRVFPTGALIWLIAGGVFFIAGSVVYVTKTLNFVPGVFGFHEVWHLFVIAGCLCHFMLILLYIAPVARVP
jgi:hemolysin III